MIRLNLNTQHSTKKPDKKLLLHWANLLAESYLVKPRDAAEWVTDTNCLEFVALFLKSQGWAVCAYTTPAAFDGRVISYGYELDPKCDEYVRWALTV